MKPISPIIPGLEEYEIKIAENQDEYETLVALPVNGPPNDPEYIVTRWKMTWRERFLAFIHGDIYLSVWTFGRPLQPLMMDAGLPPEFLSNAAMTAAAVDKEATNV